MSIPSDSNYTNYPASATYDPDDPEGMRGLESDAAFSSAPSPAPSLWSQLSDAQRWGVIGATLKDVGAHLDGRPHEAVHLDALQAATKMPSPLNPQAPSNQVAPGSALQGYVRPQIGRPGALALNALGQLRIFG